MILIRSRLPQFAALACLAFSLASGCNHPEATNGGGKQAASNKKAADSLEFEATFEGDSTNLKHTQVVATLDQPLARGKNTVWCASFQAAWKRLQEDLAKEPVKLEDGPAIVDSLNRADDPREILPEGSFYVAAGFISDGILNRIRSEVPTIFPGKKPLSSLNPADRAAVAYCYLQVRLSFETAYFQSKQPVKFVSSDGKTTEIHSFGIHPGDEITDDRFYYQPSVLFQGRTGKDNRVEFVVDLDCRSRSSQVVIAMVEPAESLAKTLASVEKKVQQYQSKGKSSKLDTHRLMIPDMAWKLSHRYVELMDKEFLNPRLRERFLVEALQDIDFRMDRHGIKLASEANIGVDSAMRRDPIEYVVDRPFLVYLKERDADRPYFAMWVDNAELLRPWNKETKPKKAKPQTARPDSPKTASKRTKRLANWAQPIKLEGAPNLFKVSDVLYRSAQPTAQGMKNLKKLGIKTIVNLRSFHSDRQEIGATGLAYEHIYMKAWHPETKEAARFLQIVNDPARQPVLVHCQHGSDRTGTMCALYRIAVQDWSKKDAIREMRDGGYGFHRI
jgi:protein tyrosine phosphatase (PTP) superfamily phosphohydrolase (DUF442 family)